VGAKKHIEIDKPSLISAWSYLMGIYLIWYLKSEGLLEKYALQVIEYKRYQDEERFNKLISIIIKNEMKKFHVTPEEIKEIVDKVVKKPTFKIIYSVDLLNSPVCPLPLRD
jgi:hypothetical protein